MRIGKIGWVFGLGSHREVDLIEVDWIGGKKDVLRNVAADQPITITEAAGELK